MNNKPLLFLPIAALLSIMFFSQTAIACEPCGKKLSFDETVNNSDLIIIGRRTDYSPSESSSFGPDTINVKILDILKGNINQNQISIHSWSGMCPYGIVADDKKYVMLLQKRGDNYYDSVDFGCSVKTLLIEDNIVDLNGQKISINELAAKLGLSKYKIETSDDAGFKQSSYAYYAALLVIILFAVLFVMNSKKKQ